MPRPRYTISAADVLHAVEYLKPRLQTFAIHLRDASHRIAQKEFGEIVALRGREGKAENLNKWCEKHLSSKEWTKLKTSIRKRRERKSRLGELRSISISLKAFKLVQKIAARDKVTYSQVLEDYLGKAVRFKRANVR